MSGRGLASVVVAVVLALLLFLQGEGAVGGTESLEIGDPDSDSSSAATGLAVSEGPYPILDARNGSDELEWADTDFESVSNQTSSMLITARHANSNVCFSVNVTDPTYNSDDELDILLDPGNDGGQIPDEDDIWFRLGRNAVSRSQWRASGWWEAISETWFLALDTFTAGWHVEFCVKYGELGIVPGNGVTIGVAFRALDYGSSRVVEWPTGASLTVPDSWGDLYSTDLWKTHRTHTWIDQQQAGLGGLPKPRRDHAGAYDELRDRLIVFGGGLDRMTGGAGGRLLDNDVWVLENATSVAAQPVWRKVLPTGWLGAPTPRDGASVVYNATGDTLVMFGGQTLNDKHADAWILRNATSIAGPPTWRRLMPSCPQWCATQRWRHTALLDPTGDQMLVFGGEMSLDWLNDAHILENATTAGIPTWKVAFPGCAACQPPGRRGHSTVYAAANDRVILYGGRTGATGTFYNDVWVLENAFGGVGRKWTNIVPNGNPSAPALEGHVAAYHAPSDRMIVFGGERISNNYYQLWALENASGVSGIPKWVLLMNQWDATSARAWTVEGYNVAQDRLLMFGGDVDYPVALGDFNDVVVLENASGWNGPPRFRQKSSGGPRLPPDRGWLSDWYEPGTDLLGGLARNVSSGSWTRAGELRDASGSGGIPVWSERDITGTLPLEVNNPVRAYDPGSDRLVLFGGRFGTTYRNDLWVLENATSRSGLPRWTNLIPDKQTGNPPGRSYHSAVYNETSDVLVVFGGQNSTAPRFNDTWRLENATRRSGAPSWTALSIPGAPSQRSRHSATYDRSTDRMIVNGGAHTTGTFTDVWVLENASAELGVQRWKQLDPTPPPNGLRPYGGSEWLFIQPANRMVSYSLDSTLAGSRALWMLENANGLGGRPAWRVVQPVGWPYEPSPTTGSSALQSFGSTFVRHPGSDTAILRGSPVWGLTNASLAPPLRPEPIGANPGNGQVELVWGAARTDAGHPISGYRIYRGVAGLEFLVAKVPNVTSHTDTGLVNGQTYSYRVVAFSDIGIGLPSDAVEATPATIPELGFPGFVVLVCVAVLFLLPNSNRRRTMPERRRLRFRDSPGLIHTSF